MCIIVFYHVLKTQIEGRGEKVKGRPRSTFNPSCPHQIVVLGKNRSYDLKLVCLYNYKSGFASISRVYQKLQKDPTRKQKNNNNNNT